MTLKELSAEALREAFRRKARRDLANQPWTRAFGGLRHLHRENKRVDQIIAAEFRRIDKDEWQ